MIEISVIIVSFNVKKYLEQSLRSIMAALRGMSSEVIVVDNGSRDGSVSMIRRRFPEVLIIDNKDNLGFARATNQALKRIRGRAVCLINPDTVVREDTFRLCLKYLNDHEDVGVVGCKIINPDGTLQLSCRRSFPTPFIALTKVFGLSRLFPWSRVFGRYNLTYLDPDETVEVDAVSGSFMIVRKSVVDDVGMLDENFFLYGEDLDWCYRIKERGWKIVYYPAAQIIHYKGRSTQEAEFNSLHFFYEAMHLFVKKHFRSGWFLFPHWFIRLGIWIRSLISFAARAASRIAAALLDALLLQAGLLAAIYIRFGNLDYWHAYRVINCVYTIFWMGCFWATGLYRKKVHNGARAVAGVVCGLVLNTSFTFFFPQYAFSRIVIMLAGLFDALFTGGWRWMLGRISRLHFISLGRIGRSLSRRRCLIVGSSESLQDAIARLKERSVSSYEIVGILGFDEQDVEQDYDSEIPVLGSVDDLERVAIAHKIDEVIFSSHIRQLHRMPWLIAKGRRLNLDLKMIPRKDDIIIGSSSFDSGANLLLVNLEYNIFKGPNLFLKRSLDISISLILLPFTVIVMSYLALHPLYKFERAFISDGIGRSISIIRIRKRGELISGWLGYLPLIFKVLCGRMSLVGTEIVPQDFPLKMGFKPGLTGLVQISRKESGMSSEERERLNIYYLKNYSLLMDFEILFKFCKL